MDYEPPIQPDDTEPTSSATRATLARRKKHSRALPGWALLGLILFTGISLLASILLLFSPDAPDSIAEPVQLSLILGSDVRELESKAATVADLLRELNITLAADDALSPAPETAVYEGMIITIAHARLVELQVDGQRRTVRTPFDKPAAILEQEGILLDSMDKLWVDGTATNLEEIAAWPVPANEIIVQHAFTVTIIDGSNQTVVKTTAGTVGELLYEAGLTIFLTDLISPNSDEALTGDTSITINRARPVTIRVDGTSVNTRVQGGTVADALSESGIALIGLDYTIPAETEPIEANMTISVLRVTETILGTEETIPFETVYQADASLDLDQRQTIQAGVVGIQRHNERLRYEDGVEIWREPAGTEIIQAPQNAIIAYGTNIVLRTIDTPEGAREYWRQMRVYATSYHPEALGGDNRTSIGETLRFGIIGADPTLIPYRTNVFVPNYGIGMIADTGGPRSSAFWIDLGYSDDDYRSWHQYVDIYLLTPVPATINYLLPDWRPMAGQADD
jgi:resuscitation-promoting factor RpfB